MDLIDPTDKRWEVALVCAVGRHMDTVIADTAETVKACIQVCVREYLRYVAYSRTCTNAPARVGIHAGLRAK